MYLRVNGPSPPLGKIKQQRIVKDDLEFIYLSNVIDVSAIKLCKPYSGGRRCICFLFCGNGLKSQSENSTYRGDTFVRVFISQFDQQTNNYIFALCFMRFWKMNYCPKDGLIESPAIVQNRDAINLYSYSYVANLINTA